MAEFYKEIARYRADVLHERTGEMIDYRAAVYEGPAEGRFSIRHSHTFRPTEDAGGAYYSNTFTQADDAAQAESLVRDWVAQIASSYEVVGWVENI